MLWDVYDLLYPRDQFHNWLFWGFEREQAAVDQQLIKKFASVLEKLNQLKKTQSWQQMTRVIHAYYIPNEYVYESLQLL